MLNKWRIGFLASGIFLAVISVFLPWTRMMTVIRKYGPNKKLMETRVKIEGGFWEGHSPLETESFFGVVLPLVAAGLMIWLGVRLVQGWRRLEVSGGLMPRLRAGWTAPEWYQESPKRVWITCGAAALAVIGWVYWWVNFLGIPAFGFWVMALGIALAALSGGLARPVSPQLTPPA